MDNAEIKKQHAEVPKPDPNEDHVANMALSDYPFLFAFMSLM